MNYRNLGASGLKVSELSLGSWTTYGGSVGVEETTRIVHRAFEAGVNLFDTADVYVKGEAEKALGAAIRGLPREQLVIATKCMGRVWDGPLGRGLSRKHIFEACDRSLQRLGLDHIDLYQFHAPDPEAPLEESLRAFEDLVCIGKVLHVGFSNFDHHPKIAAQVPVIQKARGWMPMISSQPRWNLVDRHVEPEHVAFCKKHGIGMIVYSPLAQGVLTNKYAGGARPEGSRASGSFAHFLESEKALTPENIAAAERFAAWCAGRGLEPAPVALAWVLRHDVVSSAIVGATSTSQLEQNLRALEVKLSEGEWREVEAAISGGRGRAGAGAKPSKARVTPKRAARKSRR
jgi:aryl-alcohol dehydrogenase-like predicted oxidoreductase